MDSKEIFCKFIYLKVKQNEIEELIKNKKIKSEKHIRILEFLFNNEGVTLSELEMLTDTTRNIVKTLEKNGYLEIVEEQVDRNPFFNKNVKPTTRLSLML